jgi:deoxyribodipyrimidine photolyase-related protein
MHASEPPKAVDRLVVCLGDQLNADSRALDGFDAETDAIWMAETVEESEFVWSTQARIAMFLSAMRHFAAEQRDRGRRVLYQRLGDTDAAPALGEALSAALRAVRTGKVVCVRPGAHRIQQMLQRTCRQSGVELEMLEDRHFLSTPARFDEWAEGRKSLRQEYWYRHLRKHTGVLMDGADPAGGDWNFDRQNRQAFPTEGPGEVKAPRSFQPDAITREVLDLVADRFADHPGSCESFDYPVTHEQALAANRDFLHHRLAGFGTFQDAMWEDRPWLYHSRLSAAMNLHLLDPRKVIEDAEAAWRDGDVPLNAAEGFIRQILGWREYVRGVYWRFMPDYLERNALDAEADLPGFYWTGRTEAHCLGQCITQTLQLGYAHHIQRLMVTGTFAMMLGVRPQEVHRWYLAVYVDAVEWVELPNTLGMSQFADGGVMASKPYAATGKYIRRMGNYCNACRYDPETRCGEDACPFTTLYWDFLLRNRETVGQFGRMGLALKNLDRLDAAEKRQIRRAGDALREQMR